MSARSTDVRYSVSKAKAGLWPGAEAGQTQARIAGEQREQQALHFALFPSAVPAPISNPVQHGALPHPEIM